MTWLVRSLPFAAVVYGGGISGAWLGKQFTSPLPAWVWGWFGAGLTVLAVLVGIELAMRGDWTGWGIMALSGIATCVMDFQYFNGSHDWLTSCALGIMPTGIAILSGIAASRLAVKAEVVQTQTESERERWERERQERDDEHRRKLEELKVKAELKAIQPPAPVHSAVHSNERPVNGTIDYSSIFTLIASDPNLSIAKMSEVTGISAGAIHGELKRQGYHKNGHGWERIA
jgi:hypothetical protein